MKGLPPEFDAEGCTGNRLWVRIEGDQACLAALRREIMKIGLEVVLEGEMLAGLAPISAETDQLLAALAAAVDRINAGVAGSAGAVLSETRMVAAAVPPAGEAIRLGARFRLLAGGSQGKATDDVIVLIDSTVFGSGLHPSTRLAVQAMDELAGLTPDFPGRVLDVGTGSGLLAMIAARRGAATVLGIDICPEALAVARDNVLANGLIGRVAVSASPLDRITGCFDLILANLTASVQLRLAADIRSRLQPGGELIVSGLQGRQQEEFAAYWQGMGLKPVASYAEGSWRALRLKRVKSELIRDP